MDLSKLDMQFLCACNELVIRQQQLIPVLSMTLGVAPQELFYVAAMGRLVEPSGDFLNGEWSYFFHGQECDIHNNTDGRMLRVEFGPRGRTDTFGGESVLAFVMHSRAPWREFPELKQHIAAELEIPEPTAPYWKAGSLEKMWFLQDRALQAGMIERVNLSAMPPDEQYRSDCPLNSVGSGKIRPFSPEQIAFRLVLDSIVGNRLVLSEKGIDTLTKSQCYSPAPV